MTIKANFPAIKPSLNLDFANSKVLDPRITFSRASTATYYDGKTTVKAEENLLLRSQEFDVITAWSLGSASISANSVVAPDGTLTADTFLGDGSSQQHRCYQGFTPISGLPYVFSVYAKAGTNSFLQLLIPFSMNHYANFDLSSGVLGTVGSAATASIVGVGNGWYRCSITLTSTFSTATNTLICLVDSATAGYFQANTLATSVYIWGAQLEQRSTVTAYTPTTTAPITNRIPALQTAAANVARFDHDPVTGESKGMLIEEQRTNLLTYSEFQNGTTDAPTRSNISTKTFNGLVQNPVNSIYFNVSGASTYAYKSIELQGSTTYTFSAFVRMDDGLAPIFGSSTPSASSNDFAIVMEGIALSPLTYPVIGLGNGVYRVYASYTSSASPTSLNVGIVKYNSNSSRLFSVTGFQLETGSFPTSYIPTAAAQVTRSADSASITGSNFTSISANGNGTLYMEFDQMTSENADRIIAAIYSTSWTNNAVHSRTYGTTLVNATYYGATSQGSTNHANLELGKTYRLALAFAQDDVASVLSGGSVVTDTTVNLPSSTFNTLDIGGAGSTTAKRCGHITRIAYYPKRLSNTHLQSLTS